MNSRGFTVVEVLVALVITGVVMGLTLQTVMETRQLVKSSDELADHLGKTTQIMTRLDEWITLMNPSSEAVFRWNRLEFSVHDSGRLRRVIVGSDNDKIQLKQDDRTIIEHEGDIQFRYLGDVWEDSWEVDHLPRAVAISILPKSGVENEPYEMVINVPAGIFQITPTLVVEDESAMLGNSITSEVSDEI